MRYPPQGLQRHAVRHEPNGVDEVNDIDLGAGIDASVHAVRHLVGLPYQDSLSVGVPVATGLTNQQGAAPEFVRRDHVHQRYPSVQKWVVSDVELGEVPTAGATRYFCPIGDLVQAGVEARAALLAHCDGTLSNLRVYAVAAANDAVVTVRVSGVDTLLVVAITGGGGEARYNNTVNLASVSTGDGVSIMIVSDGAGSPTVYRIELDFTPDP